MYASLLEHQAEMQASGELARQLAENRRMFWRRTFPVMVLPQPLLAGLVMGVAAYFGVDVERIITVGLAGVVATLVAFLIMYPRT